MREQVDSTTSRAETQKLIDKKIIISHLKITFNLWFDQIIFWGEKFDISVESHRRQMAHHRHVNRLALGFQNRESRGRVGRLYH